MPGEYFEYGNIGNETGYVQDEETVDEIIKYSVLPTMAYGTVIFCVTMFVVNLTVLFNIIYSLPGLILSIVAYFALAIATFVTGMQGKNNVALPLFYALCFSAGLVQAPVVGYGLVLLGDLQEVLMLFTVAVFAATATVFTIYMLTRYSSRFFNPGSGFVRISIYIVMFASVGFLVWMISSLLIGNFSLYLLGSSFLAVFLTGFCTLYDLAALRDRVSSGRWVYATAHLALDYFILIVRIFLILVIGRSSRD
ncbi:hypothetical protein GF325_09850 [Candidatus Bathyarchaeota archaeon]|nr:hypothetical protein [Candidatus Bathyarchaeota archaeon]